MNRVKAEIGTAMLATFARTTHPFKALFVGMEPGAYLILRFPPGSGIHDHLFEGNTVVVKYVSGGTVYGFRTEVMAYLYKKRIILVVLAFPDIVETVALRKEHRIDFLVPARLTVAGEGLDGFVVDLSPSGCRFAMDATPEQIHYDFKIIKEATIAFQLIGQEGIKELRCQVKNIGPENAPLSLGLSFNQADESVIEGIRNYVHQVSTFLEGSD